MSGETDTLEAVLARCMSMAGPVRDLTPEEIAAAAERQGQEEQEERLDRERDQRRRESRWRTLVPARHSWARFNAPELAKRVRPATAIEASRPMVHANHLAFVGQPGTGKTTLAVAMLRARFDAGVRVWFAPACLLGVARIQAAAGHGEASEVQAAMDAELTLIDDVGAERQTQNNAIVDVLHQRHYADAATWITTGLTVDQFADRYGGGAARRVFEEATIIRLGVR